MLPVTYSVRKCRHNAKDSLPLMNRDMIMSRLKHRMQQAHTTIRQNMNNTGVQVLGFRV